MAVGRPKPPLLLHSERYAAQLATGWQSVLAFLASLSVALSSLGRSPRLWDSVLVRYVKERYQKGAARSGTTYGLLSVQKRFRWSRQQLPSAWAWAWAWRERAPPTSATPCPRPIVEAVLGVLFSLGVASTCRRIRKMYLSALGVLWAGYEAMLRPIEIAGLSTSSIVFGDELGETSAEYAVLVIWVPKNRRAFGLRQFVLLDSLPAVTYLKWLYSLTAAGRLFTSGQPKSGELFRILKIPAGTFTLRGLRGGMASETFRKTRNVGMLQFTGRWRKLTTMHCYLQEAAAALISAKLSVDSRDAVIAARDLFLKLKEQCDVGVPLAVRQLLASSA